MRSKITIVDYGLGNIYSVSRAFEFIGCNVEIATNVEMISKADCLVLPGVGAFKKGIQTLSQLQFIEPIKEHAARGKPLLGICLGMQLLFDYSEENGFDEGLALLPGKVTRIVPTDSDIKVPHVGWSRLSVNPSHENKDLFLETLQHQYAYFVHSYHPVMCEQHLLATTSYHSHVIHSVVMKDNVIGCQFHPEKSGRNMLKFLEQLTQSQKLIPNMA